MQDELRALVQDKAAKLPGPLAQAFKADMASRRVTDRFGGVDDCDGSASFAEDKPSCLPAAGGQTRWDALGLPDLRTLKASHAAEAPDLLKAGRDEAEAWSILRSALSVSEGQSRIITTPTREVVIEDWALRHIVEKREAMRERFSNFILPVLTMPLEVWRTQYEDGLYRERYIKLFTGKHDMYVIVRINDDGSLLWNAVPSRVGTVQNQRAGELLWKGYGE